MVAAEAGWHNAVRLLVQHPGIQVNSCNEDGETPLALARSEETLLELLIVKGLEINKRNEDGETELMVAAEVGWETAVEVMLRYPGIDPNLGDNDGITALMNAIGETWKELSVCSFKALWSTSMYRIALGGRR